MTALRGQLESLRGVIAELPGGAYRATPSRVSGTVGAHVRHCLDHVRALVSHAGGELSYDSRQRGTAVETEPGLAVAEIDRLCAELAQIEELPADSPVNLRAQTDRAGGAVRAASTLGREMTFVFQHTIHHLAIVALLLEQVGVEVPPDFGYAPTTPNS